MNASLATEAAMGHMPPWMVDHVADAYRRYSGETATFFTRVTALADLPNYALRIRLPKGMKVATYGGPARLGTAGPRFLPNGAAWDVLWSVSDGIAAGTIDEFQTEATITAAVVEDSLACQATVYVEPAEAWPGWAEETACIAVSQRARWLRHLPALYEDDELMGRFLMLFESLWAPIEAQIDEVPLYFDPQMTPPEFLPWLASWLDLVLDDNWPEDRRRRLLRTAASLYRRRGTRQALIDYLEIYTGEAAQIIEYRASNFRLGSSARLGAGLGLGRSNMPNTFTVVLPLVPMPGADPAEAARLAAEHRRRIEAIIEAEKPAHTHYTLRLEDNER